MAEDWTAVYQSSSLYKYIPPSNIFGRDTVNETVQTINAIHSLRNGRALSSIKSLIVIFTTSIEENTESIPRTNKVRKNRIDQSHGGCISTNAAGYEMKSNSGPANASWSMSSKKGGLVKKQVLKSKNYIFGRSMSRLLQTRTCPRLSYLFCLFNKKITAASCHTSRVPGQACRTVFMSHT